MFSSSISRIGPIIYGSLIVTLACRCFREDIFPICMIIYLAHDAAYGNRADLDNLGCVFLSWV